MFTAFALTALFASSLVARADPTPNEPGPGSVFNEGSTCHIAWDPDTTGQWKNMAIELMTGDNFNMVHLTTVTTLDGTSTSTNTYDYPCPSVTPNAAIYFYQFSDPSSPNKTWTTRFAIADANGKTVDPSNASQPGGAAIPWGTGALTDPSSATPPPSGSTSSSNTSVPGSALPGAGSSSAGAGSTVVVSAPSGTTSASSKIITAKSAATNAAAPTSSGAAAGNKTTTDGSADSGAAMVGGASGLKTAVVSLAVTALVFVVGL